jgi:putative folate metabolism gamma-glutamate ligase
MQIMTYKTRPVRAYDSLLALVDQYLPKLSERSVAVITSKVISLCEGSVVAKDAVSKKSALIKQEADAYLDSDQGVTDIPLTIKNGILIPSAGIDESNGDGFYVLYPNNVLATAFSLWNHLRQRDSIQELGILITDSHTTPMRRGVIGIGLGWCGFKALHNYIGREDCFGAHLRVTMANHLDALAVAAVFCMGEGNEQTPFAVIEKCAKIEFQLTPPTAEEIEQISILIEDDIYAPLLKNVAWKRKVL